MNVAIIKYNAGNNYSVLSALNRLGVEALITDDEAELRLASKVIFPGVGEARAAMEYLRRHRLDEVIRSLSCPVLGICIGQQLMCRHSEEGDTDCLGIFDVDVVRFKSDNIDFKIPHMGWNTVNVVGDGVVPECCDGKYVYYVHSYYVPVNLHTTAVTDYIDPFSASLHKDNFYATQFHPEKSGDVGETIIKHFLEL
ncbi:MAG: imidazole glycerol phosphate synthase subunit HisH [Lachnospiraceae bacterium]|nr:imidazole glycerol phosphate synthase subunit HisH [Lachnospiraceae bacterium]